MRWPAKPLPYVKELRQVTRFAWLPVRIGLEWVWFESYALQQKFDGQRWKKC